ncbi:PTS mannose/fructose/sorbose/N-acetylgalactosamine transporter subunit IIC [Microbacteriaceae bacterium 4G12]
MDITLTQALLIGLAAAICFAGQLWGLYTNRAIVLGFIVGVILHDIPTGLAMGAISELAFMGFGVGAGGSVPPNPLGPGVIGTIMAIALKGSGMTVETALALSFPFAVLIQFAITFVYSVCAGSTAWSKKAIAEGKFRKFQLISHTTLFAFLAVGFIVGFTSAIGMGSLEAFVKAFPQWLIAGLKVAGGLLPAIGFAMILNVMVKKEYAAYLILGYVSIAYLKLPVMGVALIGAVFAINEFIRSGKEGNLDVQQEEVIEDGI